MTCIIGYTEGSRCYMIADSAGIDTSQLEKTIRKDKKIFSKRNNKGSLIVGYTSSFRMGQILQYKWQVPDQKRIDLQTYMHTLFIDSIVDTLEENGYSKNDNGQISGGTFIVAYQGQLFEICDDFQIKQDSVPYMSCGCGAQIALGAMHALLQYEPYINPEHLLMLAMESVAHTSIGVFPPFHIMSQ